MYWVYLNRIINLKDMAMSKRKNDYIAPAVEELSPKKHVDEPEVKKELPVEATFKKTLEVIGVGDFTGAGATATTDIMTKRIKRHMTFLNGSLGFKDKEDRIKEQVTFIETIGNTFRLPYEQFALVTNILVSEIHKNIEVFNTGCAFKHTKGLDKIYPAEIINLYQTYITFLSIIAGNWNRRHRLDSLVDLSYAVSKLDKAGKENVTRYFKQLVARA